jgi:hypothetical protein
LFAKLSPFVAKAIRFMVPVSYGVPRLRRVDGRWADECWTDKGVREVKWPSHGARGVEARFVAKGARRARTATQPQLLTCRELDGRTSAAKAFDRLGFRVGNPSAIGWHQRPIFQHPCYP